MILSYQKMSGWENRCRSDHAMKMSIAYICALVEEGKEASLTVTCNAPKRIVKRWEPLVFSLAKEKTFDVEMEDEVIIISKRGVRGIISFAERERTLRGHASDIMPEDEKPLYMGLSSREAHAPHCDVVEPREYSPRIEDVD